MVVTNTPNSPYDLILKVGKDSPTYHIVICIPVWDTAAHGRYTLPSSLRHTSVVLFIIRHTKLVYILTLGAYAPLHRVLCLIAYKKSQWDFLLWFFLVWPLGVTGWWYLFHCHDPVIHLGRYVFHFPQYHPLIHNYHEMPFGWRFPARRVYPLY